MTTRIEEELRELYDTEAEGFEMDGTLPPSVRKRAKARAARALSAVVAVAVIGAWSAVMLYGHSAGPRSAPVPGVRLVDYAYGSSGPDGTAVNEQVQCLRDQGFDVPDPVRTGQVEQIQLPSSVDQSSLAWREAMFVTCAMSKFNAWQAPDSLAFVASAPADVQAFLECMQAQGFDLPTPIQQGDSQYQIDLSTTSIDTSSDAWNRALFVTCTPPQPPWGYGPSGPTGGGPPGPSGATGTGPSGPAA